MSVHFTRFSSQRDWVEYFCEVQLDGTKVTVVTGQVNRGVKSQKETFADRFDTELLARAAYERHLNEQHPLWTDYEDGEREGRERVTARSEALENAVMAVEEGPSENAATVSSVYVDWLLDQGDEVGELAALALRDPKAAHDWLLMNPAPLGEVDVCYGHELELSWRHGLVRGVTLREARATPRLRRAAKSPADIIRGLGGSLFSCLTEVELDCRPSQGQGADAVADAVAALVASRGAQLRQFALVANIGVPGNVRDLFDGRLQALRSLSLSVRGRPEFWLVTLADSPVLSRLTSLALSMPHAPRPDLLSDLAEVFAHLKEFRVEFDGD